MSSERQLDFTPDSIPSSWREAATHAPEGSKDPLQKQGPMRIMPSGKSLDLFTAGLSGLVTSIIGCYTWFELEMSSTRPHPWFAIVLGIALALAIRYGGGEPDHQVRAVLALGFYVVTLLITLYLIGRAGNIALYGRASALSDFERQLLDSYATRRWSVVAWLLGAIVSIQISYLLRRRS